VVGTKTAGHEQASSRSLGEHARGAVTSFDMKTVPSAFLSGRFFLLLLAGATFGPFVLALLHVHTTGVPQIGVWGALQLLNLIAAPHVLTTLYLLLDRRNLIGVANPQLTVFLCPMALIAVSCLVLLTAPLWVVMSFMLFYVFYGMWHFGRQNLGVMSFASHIANQRPMSRFERTTLIASAVAGVLGGYRIFAPALLLNADYWPFDLSAVDPLLSKLWYGGIVIYAVLVPATLVHVARNRLRYHPLTLTIYLACVFFFLPTYLSDNALFLITSWSVAHGVQYLIFLAVHAAGRGGGRAGVQALAPFAAFVLCLIGGVALWRYSTVVQQSGESTAIRVALSLVTGLTLAHYWIDQFLWRFSSPVRRTWLRDSFGFLMPGPAPSSAVPRAAATIAYAGPDSV
jgi:hypothetical protein